MTGKLVSLSWASVVEGYVATHFYNPLGQEHYDGEKNVAAAFSTPLFCIGFIAGD